MKKFDKSDPENVQTAPAVDRPPYIWFSVPFMDTNGGIYLPISEVEKHVANGYKLFTDVYYGQGNRIICMERKDA
jgi:hypothetical protein